MDQINKDLRSAGLPTDDYIQHPGMLLSYSEQHEQAKWVAHIIHPKIRDSRGKRKDIFIADPKIKTGSAEENDYGKQEMKNGQLNYVDHGYDRGHLVPVADLVWSQKAIDSTFYYSNISPQLAAFNRGIWSKLEAALRSYVSSNNTPLQVITLPIFDNLKNPTNKGPNQVSIPKGFMKVVLDKDQQRGMAVYMNHQVSNAELSSFIISIDQAEAITGFDFFSNLPLGLQNSIEATVNPDVWFTKLNPGDRHPIDNRRLAKGQINTAAVASFPEQTEVEVCGYLTSQKKAAPNENIYFNLDKRFPDYYFCGIIFAADAKHLTSDVQGLYANKEICISGVISYWKGKPQIKIQDENQIRLLK